MKNPALLAIGALLVSSCAALGSSSTREIVYVAEASGGAWGAATKARAAMTSVEGIETLHMSGARAVFQLERGASVSKEALAEAFEQQGMTLESLERVERPRAAARYLVDSPVTWATTAAKVRVALIEKTGALDVYFEETIEILMPDEAALSEETVRAILAEAEVAFSRLQRSSTP